MRVKIRRLGSVLGLLGGLCLSSAASAAVLPPGAVDFPAEDAAPPSGTVVASVLLPFVSEPGGLFTGTLLSQVFQGDTANPHGGLTFVYQLANHQSSANSINRVTASTFDQHITDVSYVAGQGVAPAFVDRGITGDPVGFSFHPAPLGSGSIQPGQFTNMLVIRTDSQQYFQGNVGVINGGVAAVNGFAPIPEPTALGFIGAAGLMLIRRRK